MEATVGLAGSRMLRLFARFALGTIAALAVLIAGIAAFLAWWPEGVPPRSENLNPPAQVRAFGGLGQITVEWTAAPGAVCYQVYRGEKAAGPFRPMSLASGPVSKLDRRLSNFLLPGFAFDLTPRSPFVDTAIEAGRTYHYKVASCDGRLLSVASEAVSAASLSQGDATVRVFVDAAREAGALQRNWEVTLGSEHLSYMLKGDLGPRLEAVGNGLRQANKRCHDEFGVRFIRAHGIFLDELGVYREGDDGKPVYDWSGVDRVYDMLIADGLRPFVELSFMPLPLAFDPDETIFFYQAHASVPRDYRKWGALITEFARHLIDRYGREEVESWYFEVWNEPDLRSHIVGAFWHGSDEEYFRLYDVAAGALKSVDPKLRVGGPAAATHSFVEPFLRHIAGSKKVTGSRPPLDFLSVHTFYSPVWDWKPLLEKYGLGALPVMYTEWGVSARWGEEINDLPYGAAWLARALMESSQQVEMVSYWTASDYFEELGPPERFFHGGFGLLGLEGIRKPRYWAFHLLHQLGSRRLYLQGEGDGFGGLVQGWATRDDRGTVRILLANVTYDQTRAESGSEGAGLLRRHVALDVAGMAPGARYGFRHWRVDDTHSNVYAAWRSLGKPRWPDEAQLAQLQVRDALELLEPAREQAATPAGNVRCEFDLPMPALSLIEISENR